MKKSLLVFSSFILLWSCGNKPSSENTNTTDTNKTSENVTTTETSGCPIKENEFMGVKIGMKLQDGFDAYEGFVEKKAVMETGESDVEYYPMINEAGDEIARVYDLDDKIFSMEIITPECSLDNGIHVGSTLGELKKAYPKHEIHGSEIEGRTLFTVPGKNVSFYLEVGIWNFDLTEEDKKQLTDDVKIYQISIF